jgi:ribosomal protein L37E
MGLFICEKCGKVASNNASACFHCGYPIQGKKKKTDTKKTGREPWTTVSGLLQLILSKIATIKRV